MTQSKQAPCLYLVPTPIGNLGDMSYRAVQVLGQVHRIYAEDTRRTGILCQHYMIKSPLCSLHQHNEAARIDAVLHDLREGHDVALVSDAGTPLISDPGARLVPAVWDAGFKVVPLPGACAAVCALSASKVSSEAFFFVGFVPSQRAAREAALEALKADKATLVFYESCHRIKAFLASAARVFGEGRRASVGRELTKRHECFTHGPLAQLAEQAEEGSLPARGEFVVCIEGVPASEQAASSSDADLDKLLDVLLLDCSLKSAVRIAVALTDEKKSRVYARALVRKDALG